MEKFKPNENYFHYLYWIVERQNIFWRKYNGEKPPYTFDDILQNFKFTNVYRCLDRVSQYLIKEVIYNGTEYEQEDIFFRILLFKHFNKIETWEAFKKEFGDVSLLKLTFEDLAKFCDSYIAFGNTLYSNAYTVGANFYMYPEYKHFKGWPKHRAYFNVFEKEIFDNGYIYQILDSKSLEDLYNRLRCLKIYGDFTAQQYALDYNYSTLFNFSENDFVITGPGSLKGLKFVFNDASGKRFDNIGAIKWIQETFEEKMYEFEKQAQMKWHPLPWETVPTLTNLQNTLCEISKFAKGLGFTVSKAKNQRIKNIYQQKSDNIDYTFPPKWNVKMPLSGEIKID